MKKRVLFLVQRPSDYVEMKRAAINLTRLNYACIIFLQSTSDLHNKEIIDELKDPQVRESFCKKGIIISSRKDLFSYKKKKNEKDCKNGEEVSRENNFSNNKSPKVKNKTLSKISALILRLSPVPSKPKIYKISRLIYHSFYRLNNYVIQAIFCFYRLVRYLKNLPEKILRKIKNKIKAFPIICEFLMVIYIYKVYVFSYHYYRKIIKENSIDILILPEDIVGVVTPMLIKAAKSYNVPSLILPYTIANQEEAFRSLLSNGAYHSKATYLNKFVSVFLKKWAMKKDDISLVRLPAPYVISQVLVGAAPQDPWMMNSGNADVIAVENTKMYQYYIKSGIPKDKLQITGAFYDDTLALHLAEKESYKQQLYKKYGIMEDKPILLLGGCPNQLISNPPGFDFKDLNEMVLFIVECLKPFYKTHHLFIKPHPNYVELGSVFQEQGFYLMQEDTAKLIATSDLYIAFASATIRWAICCGIPTINYDAFYYDYSDYKEVEGVQNVKTKTEFQQAAQSLAEKDYYLTTKSKISQERISWGNLDSKSGARICALIEELCVQKKSKVSQIVKENREQLCLELQ